MITTNGATQHKINVHTMATENVLAYVMMDAGGWSKVYLENSVQAIHLPEAKHRALYNAMVSLRRAGKETSDTNIMDSLPSGSGVDITYIAQIAVMFDPYLVANIQSDIDLVLKYGNAQELRAQLTKALQDLDTRDYHDVKSDLLMTLPKLGYDASQKRVTMTDLLDDFDKLMEAEPNNLHLTGINWLDGVTTGVSATDEVFHMWWIVAPYKGRKSSFMLNIALGIHAMHALAGTEAPSTAILSREMPAHRVLAQLGAMLAVSYLIEQDKHAIKDKNGLRLDVISADILKWRNKYKRWHEDKVKAIDYARSKLRAILQNIRIYDSSDKGGRLSDFRSIQRIIDEDHARYGTRLAFVDYFQLFDSGDGDSGKAARLENGAHMLQMITRQKRLSMFIVAQQNEASITGGGKSYSPNIKGTGAAAATADYILRTQYDLEIQRADQLVVEMKLSREIQGGQVATLPINAPSGLITDAKWIQAPSRFKNV